MTLLQKLTKLPDGERPFGIRLRLRPAISAGCITNAYTNCLSSDIGFPYNPVPWKSQDTFNIAFKMGGNLIGTVMPDVNTITWAITPTAHETWIRQPNANAGTAGGSN